MIVVISRYFTMIAGKLASEPKSESIGESCQSQSEIIQTSTQTKESELRSMRTQ